MKSKDHNRTLKPTRAIIIYASTGRYNDQYYLETSDITKANGKYQFSAPVPLADDILRAVSAKYLKNKTLDVGFRELIPQHILYAHNEPGDLQIIWYRPTMKRVLNFSEHLSIRGNTEVWVPGLVFWLHNKGLNIYALAGPGRPKVHTPLFRAPFFNVYKDGNVCLGSANVGKPSGMYSLYVDNYEGGFFRAEQNHGDYSKTKTPLPQLWNNLIKRKASEFPVKELLPQEKYKNVGALITTAGGSSITGGPFPRHVEEDPYLDEEEEEVNIEL